jgi:hypothetical protein
MVDRAEVIGPAPTIARAQTRRSWLDPFALETPVLTLAFWSTVLVFVVAFWIPPFPPLIDYPQHVAIGALLRRMANPAAPERSLYDVNLVTYNGGFHLAVAALSFLVSPETAGRLLLSLYPPGLAFAGLSLVRVAGRPSWYAFFLLPITLSFAVGWGFANYFISVPLSILAFTWWLRRQRGEEGLLLRIMIASFVLAYTHVLATLCLCVMVGIAGLVLFPSYGATFSRRLVGLLKAPLALWPAIVWCMLVFVRNRYSPHANWEGWDDGIDDPLWYKLLHLTAYAVGNFSDHTDQILLTLAAAIMICVYKWNGDRADPLMRVLALAWAALYCIIPKVFIATWFIFERFPTFALAFAAAAAPVIEGRGARALRSALASIAVVASLNTAWHLGRIPDEADANAIIDEIPAGKRAIMVTWSNHGENVILREMWVHLLAYYQARRPGLIAYSFAKFESMPVHYQLGKVPPVVPGGMEWDARKYDVAAPYARYWDTVLVRTPDQNPDGDPRSQTFRDAAPFVRLLARHGRFWLYDASALAAPKPRQPGSGPPAPGPPTGPPASTESRPAGSNE